ncbi:MAG: class I SAM-dependent methyltransferase [Parcubacteria group bacterium]
MTRLLLKFFIALHNFSYKAISSLVVRIHDGQHPKHDIMRYHDFFVNNITRGDVVLDIGCGNGSVAHDISKKAAQVFAIDIEEEKITVAKKKFQNDNLEYILGDATTYNFKAEFDVIILSNVLEHIENRIEFLLKIKRLAKKILIRVPLLTRDWLPVYKKEGGFEYRLDNTHFIEYTEKNFKEELEKSGLEIENYYVKFGELYAIVKQN